MIEIIKEVEAAGYRCGYATTEAEARADGCDLLFDRVGHYRALTLKGMALLDLQRQIIKTERGRGLLGISLSWSLGRGGGGDRTDADRSMPTDRSMPIVSMRSM